MRRRSTALRLLLVVVFALSTYGSAFPAPADAAPAVPHINWSPCYRETGYPFECAVVPVPLDYSRPGAATIQLALTRLPAADQAHKIGSLFLNPGGPGGSGVDFVVGIGPYIYSQEVRARYDLIGFDPRGIARSTALKCFGNAKQALATVAPIVAFPTTPEELAAWESSQRQEVAYCEQRAGRIVDHMTTADVARDLDLLRQGVGDAKLNYAGYSYGSYLGVTYASMFPDTVGALLVDAVLDPVAWATGTGDEGSTVPFFTRLRSAEGSEATLSEFFRLCDTGVGCYLAPNSEARFNALAEKLKTNPVAIPLPDGTSILITYQYFIALSLQVLYTPSAWPDYSLLAAQLEYLANSSASPASVGSQLWSVWQQIGLLTKRGTVRYPNVEGQAGVMCSDSDNPSSYETWSETADSQSQQYEHFGAVWTWISSICAPWQPGPAESRYAGPFTNATANPVLVVGNLYDPATPYHGAVAVHSLLPNSALLTVDGWGHASLFLSQCADQYVNSYLLTGAIPPEGTVCPVDSVPFHPASSQAQSAATAQPSRQELRADLIGGLFPPSTYQVAR